MKKWLKIALWAVFGLIILLAGALALFIYKVKNGFPVTYETDKPPLNVPQGRLSVLLFSKTTGYRHGEAIDASKKTFASMAQQNGWFIYETEEGGVINPEQLALFDVVIWNNSTGEVINDEQKKALQAYVEGGGGLIGIHGSGDDSHHWPWYEQHLLGALFSHHPLNPQLQETQLLLEPPADSTLWFGLPRQAKHTDEWYVFFTNPRKQGFSVLYTIDGERILPSGNLLFIKDKNFGMGKDHPVAWYKATGKGRTFYTSMGHHAEAFAQPAVVQMLNNAIRWAAQKP
jgi:hypothetical protein